MLRLAASNGEIIDNNPWLTRANETAKNAWIARKLALAKAGARQIIDHVGAQHISLEVYDGTRHNDVASLKRWQKKRSIGQRAIETRLSTPIPLGQALVRQTAAHDNEGGVTEDMVHEAGTFAIIRDFRYGKLARDNDTGIYYLAPCGDPDANGEVTISQVAQTKTDVSGFLVINPTMDFKLPDAERINIGHWSQGHADHLTSKVAQLAAAAGVELIV